jgi:hypothetical protein
MRELSVGTVFADAWAVYRLLFRRSVTTAVIVYAVVEGVDPLREIIGRDSADVVLGLVGFVLTFSGPVLVQGALVEIVRNIHEGRRPKRISELYGSALHRLPSLVWASFVYGLGVAFGLLLLIIPGLLAASRWCLMAPLIMLEGEKAGYARERSRALVKPFTWPVLGILIAGFLVTTAGSAAATNYVAYSDIGLLPGWLIDVAALSLTAPFFAHMLTVIYYRLTDPEQPVIHPDVRTWRSVWQTT